MQRTKQSSTLRLLPAMLIPTCFNTNINEFSTVQYNLLLAKQGAAPAHCCYFLILTVTPLNYGFMNFLYILGMSPGNLRTTMHWKFSHTKVHKKKNPYKFQSTVYHTNWPEMSRSVSGYKGILCLEKLACSSKKKCHHVWKTVQTIF